MKILAAHVIFSAYGFWLPNDPRGSWSDFVGAWELLRYGKAMKVTTRRSVAGAPHDRELRLRAKAALRYRAVRFTGTQAQQIGIGFGRAVEEGGYAVYGCAILHDHVHLVVAPHLRTTERIVSHLKGHATRELRASGLHPFEGQSRVSGSVPSVWAEGLWKVYCRAPAHLRSAIRYVERNPMREGLRPQRWRFVTGAPLDAPRERGG
jgi:REP element-mobilizing transposase RayT